MTAGAPLPRPLTDLERAVLQKLLTVEFPGAEDLRAQLPQTRVVARCSCGCATITLAVDTSSAAPATVTSGAPVSADVGDGDQDVGIVLLVDGSGYLSCLEVYSIGDPVGEFPPVERISPYPARYSSRRPILQPRPPAGLDRASQWVRLPWGSVSGTKPVSVPRSPVSGRPARGVGESVDESGHGSGAPTSAVRPPALRSSCSSIYSIPSATARSWPRWLSWAGKRGAMY